MLKFGSAKKQVEEKFVALAEVLDFSKSKWGGCILENRLSVRVQEDSLSLLATQRAAEKVFFLSPHFCVACLLVSGLSVV